MQWLTSNEWGGHPNNGPKLAVGQPKNKWKLVFENYIDQSYPRSASMLGWTVVYQEIFGG